MAVTLGIGALIGAIYGAKLVAKFKPAALKFLFGLLFLYVSEIYPHLFRVDLAAFVPAADP